MDASLLNKMKRKRRTSDDSRPTFNPVTPQAQHLSHVDIPSAMTPYSRTPETAWPNDGRNVHNGSPPAYEDQTDRTDWQHAHDTDRSTHDQTKVPHSDHPSEPLQTTQVNPTLARPSIVHLQETIERQLSLKIMLKHRELRLIDQEIGKCQVALEQLRRCHVIPYPAMSSSWEEMEAVASGIGRTQSNSAESAPPWGVTDGPYTRHYRHWLIPDTAFGDQVSDQLPVPQPSRIGLDRSVRASTAGKSSLVNQSRSQRSQGSARLKALPHGYPEAKEDKGPMVIKRLSDGKMVKLRCPVCERLNFNSVQGFINHCRIAHSRNFQSHEAAAIACGEEIELDQAGRIIGEPDTASAPIAGLVHPLITAKIPKPETPAVVANYMSKTPTTADSKKQLPSRGPAAAISSTETLPQTPVADNSASSASTSSPFHPSPLTPYLSNLVSKRGGGIDLEEEVNLAMTKYDVDADVLSDNDAEESDAGLEDAEAPRSSLGPVNHSTRGVVRPDHPPSRAVMAPVQLERSASVKPAKPESRRPKDLANLTSRLTHSAPRERLSPVSHTGGMMPLNHSGRLHDEAASPNLSPNTAESHQAPSLISDDDDFENTHSECSSTADVADDLERHYFGMNFESHDEHAMEDIDGATSSAGASHLGLGAELKGSHQPRRSSAMRSPDTIRNPIIDHSERHVTFASPMQRPRKKAGK